MPIVQYYLMFYINLIWFIIFYKIILVISMTLILIKIPSQNKKRLKLIQTAFLSQLDMVNNQFSLIGEDLKWVKWFPLVIIEPLVFEYFFFFSAFSFID